MAKPSKTSTDEANPQKSQEQQQQRLAFITSTHPADERDPTTRTFIRRHVMQDIGKSRRKEGNPRRRKLITVPLEVRPDHLHGSHEHEGDDQAGSCTSKCVQEQTRESIQLIHLSSKLRNGKLNHMKWSHDLRVLYLRPPAILELTHSNDILLSLIRKIMSFYPTVSPKLRSPFIVLILTQSSLQRYTWESTKLSRKLVGGRTQRLWILSPRSVKLRRPDLEATPRRFREQEIKFPYDESYSIRQSAFVRPCSFDV